MEFGNRLSSLLKERGMKQADLASKTGITPQSISKYIKDATLPDLDSVIKISKVLNVSIDSIVGNDISPLSSEETYSTRNLIKALVIIADELRFDVDYDSVNVGTTLKPSFDSCKNLSDEMNYFAIQNFFSSWVKYRALLKNGDITKEEYKTLWLSRLDREFL